MQVGGRYLLRGSFKACLLLRFDSVFSQLGSANLHRGEKKRCFSSKTIILGCILLLHVFEARRRVVRRVGCFSAAPHETVGRAERAEQGSAADPVEYFCGDVPVPGTPSVSVDQATLRPFD